MASTLDFSEVVRLINKTKSTQIEEVPSKSQDGKWELYKGIHRVHTSEYPFRILYLFSRLTLFDIRVAMREIAENEETHIVYPLTLERQIASREMQEVWRERRLWNVKDYLLSYIQGEIGTYLNKLSAQKPKDYIDPRIESPSGIPRRYPNPILSYLRDPETEADSGKLAILLAEPGQGKTYLSRYLVGSIADSKIGLVPLMVDSSQWHAMPVEDQRSLLKTIVHSFKHFGAAIGWLEGHEAEFLRVTLRADIFRIVFDGFDEYILRNAGAVQPIDVLETLAELAETTGARIVITSRTSFWDANLRGDEIERFVSSHGAHVYKILPFDLEYAKNYFTRKLGDEAKISRAIETYSILRKEDEEFVGRGFVLSLIADLAEHAEGRGPKPSTSAQVMHWLIEALCEREILRQQLPLSTKEQIAMLRTFAVEVASGSKPTTELLQISMTVARANLDSKSIATSIEKLKSHPLIEKAKEADAWSFKQEQVRILLIAEELVEAEGAQAEKFVRKARLDPENWQDVAIMVVDILHRNFMEGEMIRRLRQFVRSISVAGTESGSRVLATEGPRLAAMVAFTAVERFLPRGSSHQDRTKLLVELCGGDEIRDIVLTGTVARYDFSGTKFIRCRFERVAWVNCTFDERTEFRYCVFLGVVPPQQCTGIGSVKLMGTELDPESAAVFNSERIREGRRKYSVEDLRADIDSVVSKFIIKGGIGIKSVDARNLQKGRIGASRYRAEVIEVLTSNVLERHHISGAGDGFNVRKEATDAVKFYAANNVFTGPLREAFERLQRRLELES